MDLTPLGELYKELAEKKRLFQEKMKKTGLQGLMEEIAEAEKTLYSMKNVAGDAVPESMWEKDLFSKGKKEVFYNGGAGLVRSTTVNRNIVPKKMIEEFPLLVNTLVEEGKVKFYLKDVKDRISEEEMASIIEIETRHSYEVVLRKSAKQTGKKKEKKKIKAKA